MENRLLEEQHIELSNEQHLVYLWFEPKQQKFGITVNGQTIKVSGLWSIVEEELKNYDNLKESSKKAEMCVIDFLDREKNYTLNRKYFLLPNHYEKAIKWGRDNIHNFNMDMIDYVNYSC